MSIPSSSSSSSSSTSITSKITTKLRSFSISPTEIHTPLKTHLKFPSFSPKISLKSQEYPGNKNGSLLITNMGTYNVQVVVEDNEPEERLLGRFRREVSRAGVIQEAKRRRFFENSHDKKKRKSREAAKKYSYRFRRPRPRVVKEDIVETPKKEVYNSDEDDWDLPASDLPY